VKRIGLISDTHNFLDEAVFRHFEPCDEIWHAGDFGSAAVSDRLKEFRPLRGVYGNIDGYDIRSAFPETATWDCEGVKVLMTHIGGRPGRYEPGARKRILLEKPDLFICGHSHILRIRYDDSMNCLYMNPGAAGKQGWHQVRTLVRFTVEGADMRDCEVIELGARNS
jgi:putative phosphoesterase